MNSFFNKENKQSKCYPYNINDDKTEKKYKNIRIEIDY